MAKKKISQVSAAEQFMKITEPTAEELEAQGQQKMFDEPEAKASIKEEPSEQVQEKSTKPEQKVNISQPKVGQPKKYNEPVKSISFKLPVSSIDKLRTLANLYNKSVTQYILGKIEEDYLFNADVIEKINDIKKEM